MSDRSSNHFPDGSSVPIQVGVSNKTDGPSTPPVLLHPHRGRATAWLIFATSLWGLSFPLAKTLALAQRALLPGADSWFLAAQSLVFRFGLAGGILAVCSWPTRRQLSRSEIVQGIGLGIFSAGGMLFQMDGLSYTAASTSAFLTSCYCVTIPVIVAVQRRRFPPGLVVGSCGLVLAGMAILAGVDWHTLRLGRGESETVLASLFFAGQIIWLERPVFARNRTTHVSAIMFGALALVALPVMLACLHAPGDVVVASFGSLPVSALLLALTLFCTLATFTLMNHWQRFLEATEAGLIYCAEPVFTSVAALFLPAMLAALAGVVYANELPTLRLLIGGGLITVANICIQLRPKAVTPI